jgi:DNA topoisomerase VI subunit A
LNTLREELHVYASNRGSMVGNIILIDSGDEIDCSRMGSGGYSIPSIVEPDVIDFKKATPSSCCMSKKTRSGADSTRTNSGGPAQLHPDPRRRPTSARRAATAAPTAQRAAIAGLLPVGQRSVGILHLQRHQAGLDQFGLRIQADGHPQRAVHRLRSKDYDRCNLSPSVTITLSDTDIKRAKQIASYPWFEKKKPWQKEIEQMLKNGFKLEVEALISKTISYVTEEYVPARLAEEDFTGLRGPSVLRDVSSPRR